MKIIINLVVLPDQLSKFKEELSKEGGPQALAETLESDFHHQLSPFIDVEKSSVTVETPEFE